jgi:NAD(P)-dependent dehydrogenase (short-subunit alcohol dehydrogenase family)
VGLPQDKRTRTTFPSLARLRGEVHGATAEFESSPRMVRATITIPSESPLASLGIAGRRPLASFAMKDFRTLLPAATPVRRGQAAVPTSSVGNFLKDRVCLVTGGAQGIGWAITRALAAAGGTVHVCDISEEHLDTAREQAKALPWPERIRLTRCDVSDRSQVEAWCASVLKESGHIDVLVNNAAFVRWQDVLDMSVEDIERTMQVGFNAIAYTTKAVLPILRATGSGHIVNIGSSAGRIFVGSSSAAYSAVKAAVDGYTQTLQVELKDSPVHVMLVRPGTVGGTDFFRKHVPSSRMPRLADFIPPLSPDEVAQAILQGLVQRTPIVDVPRSLSVLYTLFEHAPGPLRWLARQGGSARSDFSKEPRQVA